MGQTAARIFETLILPPGLFLVVFTLGILLLRRKPILAYPMLLAGLAAFYLLSTPFFAGLLMQQVETYPALEPGSPVNPAAGAIVVLSGGMETSATEYASDTVGMHTLVRCRYAAFLQRKTGLPILASGGRINGDSTMSLAAVMADVLTTGFNAEEVWLEDRSRNTADNAFFSRALLAQKQIDTVYLVTQAWHMPRAVAIFEQAGFKVIPAPTAFEGEVPFKLTSLLPAAHAIALSRHALREVAAIIWYRIRY